MLVYHKFRFQLKFQSVNFKIFIRNNTFFKKITVVLYSEKIYRNMLQPNTIKCLFKNISIISIICKKRNSHFYFHDSKKILGLRWGFFEKN